MIKKITGLILVCTICFSASAQQLFDSVLNVSATKYPQEKIYIQTDRSYYNSGERVWFKAYIMALNTASSLSKTLYAELLNSSGEVLERRSMPVIQAGSASSFDIPAQNHDPKLFIRAYTSWMLNFDPDQLYLKPITVLQSRTVSKKPRGENFTLSLFPEGGDLIENISSRVAFKTNDQEGVPFPVKGKVTNSSGATVCNFVSVHDGMGSFTFTPVANEKYTTLWFDKNGMEHESPLPAAKKQGITLRLDNSVKSIRYTLTRQENASDAFRSFTVVAQMHQQIVYSARINLQKKAQVSAPIYSDSLPDGVIQVTVFNAGNVPVAERIAFVNNNNYSFATDLHAVEKNITKHGKTVLQVDVGGTLLTNFSIAVTDAGMDATGSNKDNIFSTLLLGAECRGYIYNPAYYFGSDEDSVKQQLDLVMMTNGWRRFSWEIMLNGKWPKITHQPDDYLSVRGKIFGLSKIDLKNRELTGVFKMPNNKAGSLLIIPIDPEGRFYAGGQYFFDTARLYYQFNNDKDKSLTSRASFVFDNGVDKAPAVHSNMLSSLYFEPGPDSSVAGKSINLSKLFQSQLDMQRTKTLQNVTVTTKQKSLKEKMDEEYTSGLFKGGDARTFTTEDDPFAISAFTVLDYLQGKVPGMQINTVGTPSISRRGSKTDVFLDESPTDLTYIQSIPMSNVAMIKVFDPPFFGAMGGGAGGAIAVYTKKGGGADPTIRGLNQVTLYGYSAIRQFYMPDYEKNNTDIPDYRTTLYWNPFLIMDTKTRRITIPVFNSDRCKKMKVIIEGMNENGQLTREEKVFE